jgi:hypothetical protein
VAGVAALAAGTLLLAGCGSDDVHVGDYDVSTAGRAACPTFLEALPEQVSDQPSRAVTGSPYAAAWGEPGEAAIVLRCGVGTPTGFTKFSSCQRANGIDWFVPESQIEDQRADVLMTTIGREPAVEVLVPARYRPPVPAMVDLEQAIKAHTTETTPCT